MEGTEGTDSLSFNSLSEVIDAMIAAGCNNLVRTVKSLIENWFE